MTNERTTSEPRTWFPALDGLRGLAALWVVVGHVVQITPVYNRFVWLPLNNGLAVDLFMLLTGFLMFSLHDRDSGFRPAEFWLRRFFRLAPLYYLWLIVGFALIPLLASFGPTYAGNPPALYDFHLVGTAQNFLFHLTFLFGLSPDLQQSTPMPDWSLALEAQFYLLFPLLAALIVRFGIVRIALAACALQILICSVFAHWLAQFSFPTLLPLKLHMFLAGMLVAEAIRSGRRLPLVLLALALTQVPIPGSGIAYAVCRLILLMLLFCCVSEPRSAIPRQIVRVLSGGAFRWLGEVSYGLYLTHVTIMHLLFHALRPVLRTGSPLLLLVGCGLTLLISLSLSWATYKLIEKPGIRLGRSVMKGMRSRRLERA